MVKEVDQASVDVIKMLLESENGKLFMFEYLNKYLRINVNPSHEQIQLIFDSTVFSATSLRIESRLRSH
jgi:hypothetical protein